MEKTLLRKSATYDADDHNVTEMSAGNREKKEKKKKTALVQYVRSAKR